MRSALAVARPYHDRMDFAGEVEVAENEIANLVQGYSRPQNTSFSLNCGGR